MAETAIQQGYYISPSGETVQIPIEQDHLAKMSGYVPAGVQQIKDFDRQQELHEKYGGTGQQILTGLEGAGQSLTFGLSTLGERALGVSPEAIKGREEENPVAHTVGSVAGVVAPAILTAGASLPEQAAAEGLGAGIRGAAKYTAPSFIGKVGHLVGHATAEALPEATSALGKLGVAAAKGAATAGAEGAAYGAGQVVHEAGLGDPNLTAASAAREIGLSGLLGLGIGGTTGALGQLVHTAANGPIGQKIAEWASELEPTANIKQATGGGGSKAAIKRLLKTVGGDRETMNGLARDGAEMGLVGPFSTPKAILEKATEAREAIGERLGQLYEAADAAAPEKAFKLGRTFSEIKDRIEKDVLPDMEKNPFEKDAAAHIRSKLGEFEDQYAEGMGAKDLHGIRKSVQEQIYGLNGFGDPNANYQKMGWQKVRGVLSDELEDGLEKAGVSTDELKTLNRQYRVASTFKDLAQEGVNKIQGNNMLPLTTVMSLLAGVVHGGVPGGALLGAAAYGAKKYGAGLVGAGARGIRNYVDSGAAESLASKTGDLISKARAAGVGSRALGASDLAAAWGQMSNSLSEPVGAPVKDLVRDLAQDRLNKQTGTPIETVAALSHLEKANQNTRDAVENGAISVLSGKGGGAQSSTWTEKELQEHADQVRKLANNSTLLNDHAQKLGEDLYEHAPNVMQALQAGLVNTVAHLNSKLPDQTPAGVLSEKPEANKSQLSKFRQTCEIADDPTTIFKAAAEGRLTPEMVQTAQVCAPELFRQMQIAALDHMAGHKSAGKQIGYKARLGLSMISGMPMDGSMRPQSIMANQAIYKLPSAKSNENMTGPGAVRPSQTGLGKLHLSNRMALPGQQRSERMGE